MKKYLVEMIGTFFLVLTVVTTAYTGIPIAAFAIASALMVMVYAGGHISGGHYNPAVSLAACIRGALDKKQLLPYMLAQFIGGAIAVLVLKLTVGCEAITFEPAEFELKGLLIAEILFTYALCYVVLQTATTKNTAGNSYYGLAIGSTVLVGALTVGGTLCVGAFNPSVALSVGIANMLTWKLVVWTILANLLAGVFAALTFKYVYTEE